MGKPDNVKCKTCIYFERGGCRVAPPRVTSMHDGDGNQIYVSAWPYITNPDRDWCGYWSDVWEYDDDVDRITIPDEPDALPPFPTMKP